MKEYVSYLRQGWRKRLLFGFIGAAGGYAYYTFIGCNGGCPITGDPWVSTAYGAFLGLLAYPGPASIPVKKEEGIQ